MTDLSLRTALTRAASPDRSNSDPSEGRFRARSGGKSTDPLVTSIRAAAFDPKLHAPEVFVHDFPGPNVVAAWLDHPAELGRTARLYEEAARKSPILLAEALCSLEILDRYQHEPIRAPKNCRLRLYQIPCESEAPEPTRSSRGESSRSQSSRSPSLRSEPSQSRAVSGSRPTAKPSQNRTSPHPSRPTATERHSAKILSPRPESPQFDPLTPQRPKKNGWFETLFFTFLTLGFLFWMIPLAKSRFFPNPNVLPDETASISHSATTPAPVPDGTASTSPSVTTTPPPIPVMVPASTLATAVLPAQPVEFSGQNGSFVEHPPKKTVLSAWPRLSLFDDGAEKNRPGTSSRRPVLKIPEKNNHVFGG